MITGDDNRDDNGYARVKAWRAKNRALWNLKQREYRRKKKLSGVGVTGSLGAVEAERRQDQAKPCDSALPSTFQTKKVGGFRMLVLPEEPQERPTMPVVKPKVFLNDHGAVISEKVWERLQEKKSVAEEKGYEFDPQ